MFDLSSFSKNRSGGRQATSHRAGTRRQNSEFRSQEPGAGGIRGQNYPRLSSIPLETWLNVRTEHGLEASLEFGRLREVTSENFRLVGPTANLWPEVA
jgi:hypothetical protein